MRSQAAPSRVSRAFGTGLLRRAVPLFGLLLLLMAATGPLTSQNESAAPAKAAPAKEAKSQDHPRIAAPAGDCLRCHLQMHKEIAADWEASLHGKRNVPCISCHGAVGVNFIRQPGATRCVACHAAMVDSMKLPAMKMAAERGEQACWNCHSPHRLNPHAALFRNDPDKEEAP